MKKINSRLEKLNSIYTEILIKIRNTVNDPVPFKGEKDETYLKRRVDNKPPRTFLGVFDMVKDKMTFSFGLETLGGRYSSSDGFSNMLNYYHENHQIIIMYQAAKLHEFFLEFNGNEIDVRNICFSSMRAIKDSSGKYWLAHNLVNPFQFDENGYMVSYLSSWQLLTEYKGRGLSTEIFYEGTEHRKYKETITRLNLGLEKIQANTIDILGFTRIQKRVLNCLRQGYSNKEIAELLDIDSVRTIEDHKRKILSHARELFPINNFSSASDVVYYLESQDII